MVQFLQVHFLLSAVPYRCAGKLSIGHDEDV